MLASRHLRDRASSCREFFMEPSDQYLKSKRNLIVFSGLLAVSATVGLEFTSKQGGSSLLPISLKDVSFLDEIFAALVLYFAFQVSLFWSAQAVAVQRLPQYRLDFWTSMSIAGAASILYIFPVFQSIVVNGYLYISSFVERMPSLVSATYFVDIATASISVISILFSIRFLTGFARGVVRGSRDRVADDEQQILSVLADSDWNFIFNPDSSRMSNKKMTFREDGTIGEGRNNNEHTWRIREGLLEILNSEGQVFSRFRYDKSKNRFLHTNDDDTLSIRSQRIEPWGATGGKS